MQRFNPFRRLQQSFRIRMVSLLTLLIVVTATTFTAFYILHESTIEKDRLVMEGKLLAWLLASNSRLAVFSEHPDMLREAAGDMLQHHHVLAATIFSEGGKLLIDRTRQLAQGRAQEWAVSSNARHELSALVTATTKPRYFEKENVFEFYAPIISGSNYSSPDSLYFKEAHSDPGRVIGVVRVVLDKKELNASLHRLLLLGVSMGILFFLIGGTLVILVTRGLTQPLSRLMDGVKALEQGYLAGRIPVETCDELGEVSRAFNVMAETLERREAENLELGEQLRHAQKMEAKEEWERTFDTVPDMIAILDADHRVVRINLAMAKGLGIAKETAIGTRIYEQLHWAETPANSALLSALIDSSAGYSGEIFQHKMQSYFLVTISPLRKKDGRIIGSVYVARDVTKRKLASDLLKQSEERFKLIAATIDEVFWMADVSSNRLLYVSPGYEHIWGHSPEFLYENPEAFYQAIHPDDRDAVFADHQFNKSSQPFEHEYRITSNGGSQRWISGRGYPVYDEHGQVKTYVGVAQDITERKHAMEEKNALQAKLIQTNKMSSLGLMVSGLGHEVNNPNNNIKLTAHLLARSWQDILPILEKQYREEGDYMIAGQLFSQAKVILPQHMAGIRDNSRRIEGIIKNLRDFTRKGGANMHLKADINAIISVAVAIVNSQIKKLTRHFRLDLDESVPVTRGNPQQLEQVIINLVLNAVQALPNRERKVTVSTSFDSEAGLIMIKVADQGAGMPPEVKERIGEPFFSTKLEHGGTGLGLAIANFIIKEHKGFLEFESRAGKGTTAVVKLPVAVNPATTHEAVHVSTRTAHNPQAAAAPARQL